MVIGAPGEVVIALIFAWCFDPEQFPDPGDIGGTVAVSEEAVVADAVLAFWEHMDEEPADELSRRQRHGGVSAGALDTVIFDAESDAALIHTDQAAVGNRDPMRIARQICQHRLWPSEGFFGIDDPVDPAQRFEECLEGRRANEVCVVAEELQLPSFVQPDQPFQNEAPIQTGQHPDGQEEILAAGDPFCPTF